VSLTHVKIQNWSVKQQSRLQLSTALPIYEKKKEKEVQNSVNTPKNKCMQWLTFHQYMILRVRFLNRTRRRNLTPTSDVLWCKDGRRARQVLHVQNKTIDNPRSCAIWSGPKIGSYAEQPTKFALEIQQIYQPQMFQRQPLLKSIWYSSSVSCVWEFVIVLDICSYCDSFVTLYYHHNPLDQILPLILEDAGCWEFVAVAS